MKKLILALLFILGFLVMTVAVLLAAPYYLYDRTLHNELRTQWLAYDNYKERLLEPSKKAKLEDVPMANKQAWQNFHFQDLLIPLPVRNPFYLVAPILNYLPKAHRTEMGILLYLPSGRNVSKVYFVPNQIFTNQIRSQKLFKLPLVKNVIKSVDQDKIWKDIFTKNLGKWNIPFEEMLYNLYLVQMRSAVLPKNFVDYRWLSDDDNMGIITLQSLNKDYKTELILKKHKSIIYSYLLLTRENMEESVAFRSKFLKEIKFRGGHESLSNIIYKEFQGLKYNRKIDHEGMLYLLSAWSHKMNRKSLIREMVEYLERGKGNSSQLEPLYDYAAKRWNTTFSSRYYEGLSDEMIKLKRSIELEEKKAEEKLREAAMEEQNVEKTLSPQEEMNQMLRRAKRNKKERTQRDRMIMD